MKLFGIQFGSAPIQPEKKGLTFISTSSTSAAISPEQIAAAPWKNGVLLALIRWAARNAGEARLRVQTLGESGWEFADHEAQDLLDSPNGQGGAKLFWSAILQSLIIDGNCYIVKVFDDNKKLRELWVLPHSKVTPIANDKGHLSHFEYGQKTYKHDQVIHIRDSVDPSNPLKGIAPVSAMLRELMTDEEASRYAKNVLSKMGQTVAISLKDTDSYFDAADAATLKEQFKSATTGEGRGEVIVCSAPIEVEKIGISPKEMLLGETISLVEQRICAVIGVDSRVLGLASSNASSTFANFSEAREAAIENFLLPLLAICADAMNSALAPHFDALGKLRFRWDFSEMRALQEDEDALADRMGKAFQSGLIKRSEGRAKLGFPVEDGDDVYVNEVMALPDLTGSPEAKSLLRQRNARKSRLYRELVRAKNAAGLDR